MFQMQSKGFVFLILLTAYGILLAYTSNMLDWYHIDEGFQFLLSDLSFGDIITATGKDAHPPLYSLILGGWLRIFGGTLAAARSLSITFTLLSTIVFYRLLRLKLPTKTSLAGVAIYSTFPQVVIYGFVGRNYALLLLLINVMSYLLLKTWAFKKLDRKPIALLIIANSLLLYTHNLGLIVFLLIQILIQLSRPSLEKRKQYLLIAGISVLLYIPWASVLWDQFQTKSMESGWLGFYPEESLRDFGFTIAPVYKTGQWIFATIYAAILYTLTTKVWRKDKSPYAKTVALFLILLFALLFGLSYVTPLFYYRYMIISLPGLAYLLSHSLPLKKILFGFVSVSIIVANLVFLNLATQSMNGSEFYNLELFLPSQNKSDMVVVDSPPYFYQLKHAGYSNLHLYDPERSNFSWSGISIIQPLDYLDNSDLGSNKIQYISAQNKDFADYFFDRGYEITESSATKKANIYVLTRFK